MACIGHQMLDALRAKYEAQYKEAEVTLKVYANNPVAIGEHPQHIEEMDKLKKINIKKIDHVFHFAAQAGVRYSAINPKKYINTNILGTINLLKFIRDKKQK